MFFGRKHKYWFSRNKLIIVRLRVAEKKADEAGSLPNSTCVSAGRFAIPNLTYLEACPIGRPFADNIVNDFSNYKSSLPFSPFARKYSAFHSARSGCIIVDGQGIRVVVPMPDAGRAGARYRVRVLYDAVSKNNGQYNRRTTKRRWCGGGRVKTTTTTTRNIPKKKKKKKRGK